MALEVVNQFIKSNSNKELGKLKTMLDCVIGENIMPEYIDKCDILYCLANRHAINHIVSYNEINRLIHIIRGGQI